MNGRGVDGGITLHRYESAGDLSSFRLTETSWARDGYRMQCLLPTVP